MYVKNEDTMRQLTESELEVASGALYESVDNSCFFSAAGAVASAFLGPWAAFVGVPGAIGACTSSSASSGSGS